MAARGWPALLDGWPWFRGPGRYPIPAYSEFMPPPRLGRKPYGEPDEPAFDPADLFGWPVGEFEEGLELRPGLHRLARHLLGAFAALAAGDPPPALAELVAADNPYWPRSLAARASRLRHERLVLLLPLALSRTQTDDGHVRWTLLGNSDSGPARPFWQGFFTAPGVERPTEWAAGFLGRLLHAAHGETAADLDALHRAGLRVLTGDRAGGPRPGWVNRLRWRAGQPLRGVRYLLTFRPFAKLPPAVRRAYLAGDLHLWPFPGSLVLWGHPGYRRLAARLPGAGQIPLQLLVPEHDGDGSLRVQKAGWTDEPGPGEEPTAETAHHTPDWPHRGPEPPDWGKVHANRLAHALFSTAPDDISLYLKPGARNSQLWTAGFAPLLDGPRAKPADLRRAEDAFCGGGRFGYRFLDPPMQVGRHAVVWRRPLVACHTPGGRAQVLDDAPLGYFTASREDRPASVVELWPRLLDRPLHAAAVRLLKDATEDEPGRTLQSVRNLLDAHDRLGGERLPHAFARRLIAAPKRQTFTAWLDTIPTFATDPEQGRWLADELLRLTDPPPASISRQSAPPSLTFGRTARRSFEVAYWKAIAWLSGGGFPDRCAADPAMDRRTVAARGHYPRGLDTLADALLARHRTVVERSGVAGAAVGELPFRWETEFDYPWMGGWAASQTAVASERDLVVVIPGRDRSRAVILADHYDTAYRKDLYDPAWGGHRVRAAAPGADDNGSATAALLVAAPVLLDLSRRGKLGCDVWLVHLTGEEFPAEGTGARHLCRRLVEGDLRLRLPAGELDLSGVRVAGVFVMDMIAHNHRASRDVFQIAPGAGPEAMHLAHVAHRAAEDWNAVAAAWNRRPERRSVGRAKRSRHPDRVPGPFRHLQLTGEVRPAGDPRSTFYNADGLEFSDAGVSAVLLMEDYDIGRVGYHDDRDAVALIDLDYGSALAAIAIESTARVAAGPGC